MTMAQHPSFTVFHEQPDMRRTSAGLQAARHITTYPGYGPDPEKALADVVADAPCLAGEFTLYRGRLARRPDDAPLARFAA